MDSVAGLIGQSAGRNSVPSHPTPLQSLAGGSKPRTTEMSSPSLPSVQASVVPTPTESEPRITTSGDDAQGLRGPLPSLEAADDVSTLTAAQGNSVPALDASGLANGLRTMEALAKMGSLVDTTIGAGAVATGLTCLPCRLAKVCLVKKHLLELDSRINPVDLFPPVSCVAPPSPDILSGEM